MKVISLIDRRRIRVGIFAWQLFVLIALCLWMIVALAQAPMMPIVQDPSCEHCETKAVALARWDVVSHLARLKCSDPMKSWAALNACLIEADAADNQRGWVR